MKKSFYEGKNKKFYLKAAKKLNKTPTEIQLWD